MKDYIVVYTLPGKPGLDHAIVSALHKQDARDRFKSMNIKYRSILKVIL